MYAAVFYKKKISSPQTEALKAKERKATVAFFLMFLSVFVISIPAGVISLIAHVAAVATDSTQSAWLHIVDVLTLNVFILGHIADPIFIIYHQFNM